MANESGGGGWLGQALVAAGTAGANAITKGGPKRQYKYAKKLARWQNRKNRENQQWLLDQQRILTAEQLAYDSPEQQMARYKKAGLNPNLIYGQGSPGNMSTPIDAGSLPAVDGGSVNIAPLELGTDMLRGYQTAVGAELTGAKTLESQAKTEVLGIQKLIAETNPMLDPSVANAVAQQMLITAQVKQQQGTWELQSSGDKTNGFNKMDADLQKLFNENFLQGRSIANSEKDLAIKNEILRSKQFDNAIKEINAKWLKDGDMTPEHIRTGLMLILSKMIGK